MYKYFGDDNTRMPNEHGFVVWKAAELNKDTLVVEYNELVRMGIIKEVK